MVVAGKMIFDRLENRTASMPIGNSASVASAAHAGAGSDEHF
jgi:hypothetical protein